MTTPRRTYTNTQPVTDQRIMSSLLASIDRDPNPQAYCKGAVLSTNGLGLSVFAPDGTEFIISIRKVD